jgi:lipid-A-disaccharide synthase
MVLNRLFIVTGDPSADIHAASVVQTLRAEQPAIQIEAIGGVHLQSLGVPLLSDQSKMSKVGLGALAGVWDHYWLAQKLLKHLEAFQPDWVLLIDYGGFNLWLSGLLKKRGYKIAYFIPPQVWASRKGRLKTIKKNVDHVFCIFPFEKPLYEQEGIPVTYVGHPLAGQLAPPADRLAFCQRHGLSPSEPIVALFPGSRKSEIGFLLEPILHALPLIQEGYPDPLQFVIAKASHLDLVWFQAQLDALYAKMPILNGLNVSVVDGSENHALMSLAKVGVVKSGTSTLEAALYKLPMAIIYKVQPFIFAIGKRICYLPVLGLPNILTDPNHPPIPEVLQGDLTGRNLADAIIPLLFPERVEWQRQQAAFDQIQASLGTAQTPLAVAQGLLRIAGHVRQPVPLGDPTNPSGLLN